MYMLIVKRITFYSMYMLMVKRITFYSMYHVNGKTDNILQYVHAK